MDRNTRMYPYEQDDTDSRDYMTIHGAIELSVAGGAFCRLNDKYLVTVRRSFDAHHFRFSLIYDFRTIVKTTIVREPTPMDMETCQREALTPFAKQIKFGRRIGVGRRDYIWLPIDFITPLMEELFLGPDRVLYVLDDGS